MSTAPPAPFLRPEVVPADVHRRAARLLLFDAQGRVLAEHVRVHGDPRQGSWWELPGGGLEPGESTAQAARRELVEETGYRDVTVGPVIATRRVRYRGSARIGEQHETFHVARLRSQQRDATARDPAELHGILEVAWLTRDELADGRRTEPTELARLAAHVLDTEVPVPCRLLDADDVGWSDATPRPRALPDGGRPHVLADRVVRDAAPWTPAVQAWLAHCHARGVTGVPAPLGIDVHGREAVTRLPGLVTDGAGHADLGHPGVENAGGDGGGPGVGRGVDGPFAPPLRTVEGIAAVGELLAALRDASVGFRAPPDAVWRTGTVPLAGGEVVCHGEVGHTSLVWCDDARPGLTDWESARPGPPLRDLAEAACWLVPLVAFDHERAGFDREPERRARLRALATSGGTDVRSLLAAVDRELGAEATREARPVGPWVPAWSRSHADGQLERLARVRHFLATHDLS